MVIGAAASKMTLVISTSLWARLIGWCDCWLVVFCILVRAIAVWNLGDVYRTFIVCLSLPR